MRGRAIRIKIEHASNFVLNHIPHGECYSGKSVGVPYCYFSLRKLSSVVTRSTLSSLCINNPLKILWVGDVPLVAKVHWSLTRANVFYALRKMIISSRKVLLIWISFNCAEGSKVLWELFSGKRCEAILFFFIVEKEGMYKTPWYWLDQNCQTQLQCCAVKSVVGASTHMWDGCSNKGRAHVEISQSQLSFQARRV